MIRHSANQVLRHTVNPSQLKHMLAMGRASYIFIDRDDWDYIRSHEAELNSLVRLDLPDMPAGLQRHIVCSRDVAPETMEKLNRAIAAMNLPPPVSAAPIPSRR